jgi:hypothetical protein
MKLSRLDSVLTGTQASCVGARLERNYDEISPVAVGPKKLKLVIYQCNTYSPNRDCMGFHEIQVFCRRGGGKGLTLDMGQHVDPPYSDRQRHSNLIFIPNRNASGINEHLIPDICR